MRITDWTYLKIEAKTNGYKQKESRIELLYMWLCFQIQVKTKCYIIDVGSKHKHT